VNLADAPRAVEDGALRIRQPRPADADAVLRAVEVSREALGTWMNWCTPDYGRADAEFWVQSAEPAREEGSAYLFVIESLAPRELVGACGLERLDPLDRAWRLGYWVRSDRTGRGIARRAAHLLARFAFGPLGAERLSILVATGNARSLAVAEALGAQREGLLRSRFRLRGARHDAVVLGLLPDDLAAAPA
jgi:RimJ/RimL family protein N-acetyltransferase